MVHISTINIYINLLAMIFLVCLGDNIDNKLLICISSLLFGLYFCLVCLRYQGIA